MATWSCTGWNVGNAPYDPVSSFCSEQKPGIHSLWSSVITKGRYSSFLPLRHLIHPRPQCCPLALDNPLDLMLFHLFFRSIMLTSLLNWCKMLEWSNPKPDLKVISMVTISISISPFLIIGCSNFHLNYFFSDIVNLDLKSTLRVLYNLFTKYKTISWTVVTSCFCIVTKELWIQCWMPSP